MASNSHKFGVVIPAVIAGLTVISTTCYFLDKLFPRRGRIIRRFGRAWLGESEDGHALPLFWPQGRRDHVF